VRSISPWIQELRLLTRPWVITQPDTLTIRLFELDQHGFIRTALQSASFPAVLLADLVSKRKATDAEVAEWKSIADED
jgi:hypothetical protein